MEGEKMVREKMEREKMVREKMEREGVRTRGRMGGGAVRAAAGRRSEDGGSRARTGRRGCEEGESGCPSTHNLSPFPVLSPLQVLFPVLHRLFPVLVAPQARLLPVVLVVLLLHVLGDLGLLPRMASTSWRSRRHKNCAAADIAAAAPLFNVSMSTAASRAMNAPDQGRRGS